MIVSSRATHTSDWSPNEAVSRGREIKGDAVIAVDRNGAALAVWPQGFGDNVGVYSNRSQFGSSWGTAGPLGDTTRRAAQPALAINPAGEAFAIWAQSGDQLEDVWVSRFSPADGWGQAATINSTVGMTTPRDGAPLTDVAINDDRRAVAAWVQFDGFSDRVWGNEYRPATGWQLASRIDGSVGDARGPQVAIDGDGRALAAWTQSDGRFYRVWTSRFEGSVWASPMRMAFPGEGDAVEVRIEMARDGRAVLVWLQLAELDRLGRGVVFANVYSPDGGWEGATPLSDTETRRASAPRIAVSDSGLAVAVWRQNDGTSLLSRRRSFGASRWQSRGVLEQLERGAIDEPEISIEADGTAIVVWAASGSGEADGVWTRRLVRE